MKLKGRYWSAFGDRVITYGRGDFQIRLVRDKGLWFAEARGANGRWYDFDIWQACLDGHELSEAPTSFSAQLLGFQRRWVDIERLARDETVANCLESTGRRRTEKRLGFRFG